MRDTTVETRFRREDVGVIAALTVLILPKRTLFITDP